MLELKNIHKTFQPNTPDENQLFKDFNLKVEDHEFVTVVGSNGSGKTTMLNLICGSLPLDAGEIIADGKPIHKLTEPQRYANIGRVFQDPALGTCPTMTLLENMAIADNKGRTWNLTRAVHPERIDYYRSLLRPLNLGLEDKLNVLVSSLSGGQRQAVALVMATMTPIQFLILDEHTAALDPKTAEVIMETTNHLVQEKNLSVIMVTHNLRYALEYGNRILMMHEGQVILDLKDKEKEAASVDVLLDRFNNISLEYGNSL